MNFEIAVGNGVRAVSVTRKGALLHVSVDGRTTVVDARRVGEATGARRLGLDARHLGERSAHPVVNSSTSQARIQVPVATG